MVDGTWTFGWDTLVALGTLALAAVTFALVVATVRLARQATAETRAQWKPVLLVRNRIPGDTRADFPGDTRGVRWEGALTVYVENVGRGPALATRAELDDFDKPWPGIGVPEGAPPAHSMGTLQRTAIAPQDLVPFVWVIDMPAAASGSFSYGDISGWFYETFFSIRFERKPGMPPEPQLMSQVFAEHAPPTLPLWRRLLPWRLIPRPLAGRLGVEQ